jgi:peptide/nickel transport system permease protein
MKKFGESGFGFWLKDFWKEFRKMKSGLVGLALLGLFVLAVLLEGIIIPYPDAAAHWNDPSYWEDNSRAAPPAWTNLFSASKAAVSTRIRDAEGADVSAEFAAEQAQAALRAAPKPAPEGASPAEEVVAEEVVEEELVDYGMGDIVEEELVDYGAEGAPLADSAQPEPEPAEPSASIVQRYAFTYDFGYDSSPNDVIAKLYGEGSASVRYRVTRPDGEKLSLFTGYVDLQEGRPYRVSLLNDCREGIFAFLSSKASAEAMSSLDRQKIEPLPVVFSIAGADMVSSMAPLKGPYLFELDVMMTDEVSISGGELVVAGSVDGILGTDGMKRDIFTGVIMGIKWALLIGLLTSVVTVMVGVFFGVISAYFGGWVDSLMQRITEFVLNMPLLPFMIVLSAVFKPSIAILIAIMILFFWAGPVKTVRSIGLQIREETYIEASKAIGASSWRIIFRHIVPILIPYSFASMALSVPGVIIYEATISLLGLGDTSIVTWGQILHDAFAGKAVIAGFWWWVVPPGLMIAVMGMSFAFIGTAMDKILHPKLRTR